MRFGIDLGGTKTEIIALDESGTEIYRKRVDTDPCSYEAIVATIAGLVTEAESALGSERDCGHRHPRYDLGSNGVREERQHERTERPPPGPRLRPHPQPRGAVHERRQLPGAFGSGRWCGHGLPGRFRRDPRDWLRGWYRYRR